MSQTLNLVSPLEAICLTLWNFFPLINRCVPAHPPRGPESERHHCNSWPERRFDLCHHRGVEASYIVEEKPSISERLKPGRHQCKSRLSSLSDLLLIDR